MKESKTFKQIKELKNAPLNYSKLTAINLKTNTTQQLKMGVSKAHQTDTQFIVSHTKPISKIVL